MPTRREFLGYGVAAAGLLYGLPHLVRGDEPDTAVRDAALEHIRRSGGFGVGIATPEDAAQRAALGAILVGALPPEPSRGFGAPQDTSPLGRKLMGAVYLCLPAAQLPLEAGENLVLVDGTGARVAGTAADLGDAAKLEQALERLLYGEGRLEKRAQALRDQLPRGAADLAPEEQLAPLSGEIGTSWPRFAPLLEHGIRTHESLLARVDAHLTGLPVPDAAELGATGPFAAGALDRGLARIRANGTLGIIIAGVDDPKRLAFLLALPTRWGTKIARCATFVRIAGTPEERERLNRLPYETAFVAPDGTVLGYGALSDELRDIESILQTPQKLAADEAAVARVRASLEGDPAPPSFAWVELVRQLTRGAATYRDAFGWGNPEGLHHGLRWRFDPEVRVEPEPCPPCGMAAAPPRSRKFIEFYTR